VSDLIPKTVVLESTFKSIQLTANSSDGTSVTISFTVPTGLQGKELKLQMYKEAESLHLFTLNNERMKGTITEETYQRRRKLIKENFGFLLGRTDAES